MATTRTTSSSILLDSAVGVPGSSRQVVAGSSQALGGGSAASEQLSQLVEQLQQFQSVTQTETETVLANTEAVTQNTAQLGTSGPSTANKVGSTLEDTLGTGLGLSPLITGLLSLFGGGGGSSQAAAPTPFALPPSVAVNAGVAEPASTSPSAAGVSAQPAGLSQNPQASATQITVQVQAMDSQSFLDHSSDIAMAVRQAMLQSSVLNDVIREV